MLFPSSGSKNRLRLERVSYKGKEAGRNKVKDHWPYKGQHSEEDKIKMEKPHGADSDGRCQWKINKET